MFSKIQCAWEQGKTGGLTAGGQQKIRGSIIYLEA